jgi:adenine-specific DNA-methyltransferase
LKREWKPPIARIDADYQAFAKGAALTPKPRILEIATDKDSLIPDSFAGSGTTTHAVLALNAKDGGKRPFILYETEAYAGTLPSFLALARCLFFTATGHTLPATESAADRRQLLDCASPLALSGGAGNAGRGQKRQRTAALQDAGATSDAPILIGETAVWRIYLHYRSDLAWLRSPPAAFRRTQAEAIAAGSKGTGKQALVFVGANFINHCSLRLDFAQLPHALHRAQAE